MIVTLFTRAAAHSNHVTAALADVADLELRVRQAAGRVETERAAAERVVLVHAPSFGTDLPALLDALGAVPALGVAADRPQLEEMLALSAHGIRGYFNSYMADVHYRQMVQVLNAGHAWFSPPLMARALAAARGATETGPDEALMSRLTEREREIARDVADGHSNREVAAARHISERTVKAHLTRIFRKLETPSRTALAARLNGRGAA